MIERSVVYSALSRVIKILSGPVILIAISNRFSNEEIAIYYSFFNIIAFKQMAELGVGFVIKQSIAFDSCNAEKNHKAMYEKTIFCSDWFSRVFIFIIAVVGPLGWLFLTSVDTTVNWLMPWLLLVLSTAFSVLINPILIYLEGNQEISLVYKSRLVQSIVYSVVLFSLIILGFELYSIGLAVIISSVMSLGVIRKKVKLRDYGFFSFLPINSYSSTIRYEVWPLIKRTAVVWGVGLVFWNSINLISVKLMPLELAGQLAFTLAIGKAGYSVCEGLLAPRLSKFSNMIGNGRAVEAVKSFLQIRRYSLTLLTMTYVFLIVFDTYINEVIFNNKLLGGFNLYFVLVFYFVLFLMTSKNNFVRCFKIEPFVFISVFNALLTPLSFCFAWYAGLQYYMALPLLVITFSWLAAEYVSRKKIKLYLMSASE